MLTLKQLDKTFGAGTASAHHALCGIDLTLQDGEFVTVIGSNGAQSALRVFFRTRCATQRPT